MSWDERQRGGETWDQGRWAAEMAAGGGELAVDNTEAAIKVVITAVFLSEQRVIVKTVSADQDMGTT